MHDDCLNQCILPSYFTKVYLSYSLNISKCNQLFAVIHSSSRLSSKAIYKIILLDLTLPYNVHSPSSFINFF